MNIGPASTQVFSQQDDRPDRHSPPGTLCRLPPQCVFALLAGALPHHLLDPDRLGRRRLADLRPDAQSLRSRPGRRHPVRAGAAAGAGDGCCRRPVRPAPHHGAGAAARGRLCRSPSGAHLPRPRRPHADLRRARRVRRRPRLLRPGLGVAGRQSGAGRGLRQRGRLELLGLADRHHRRPGRRRPALRPVGRGRLWRGNRPHAGGYRC